MNDYSVLYLDLKFLAMFNKEFHLIYLYHKTFPLKIVSVIKTVFLTNISVAYVDF